jgi:hypothetical protein
LGWKKVLRATGRAIEAWHLGAARTADLADRRSAVRNIVKSVRWELGQDGKFGWRVVMMHDECVELRTTLFIVSQHT